MKNAPKLHCIDPLNLLKGEAYEGDIGIDIKALSDPLIVGHRLRDGEWKYIDIAYITSCSFFSALTSISLSKSKNIYLSLGLFNLRGSI